MARHRRVLAVLSTGGGKTVLFSYITASAAAKGRRAVIVAHRVEITDQIGMALDSFGVRHGRIQPHHAMTNDPIQVGMIQSLAKRIDKVPPPDLLVIDEAHHAVSGSYAHVLAQWPNARVLGVTATPQRLDGRGLGEIFNVMAVGIPMGELIGQNYLASYDYLAPPMRADLSDVKTARGDYAIDELADAMDKSVITGDAVAHYRDHLAPRSALAFAVNVEHAEHIAASFQQAGYRAASVDGTTDPTERRDRVAAIGDGRLDVLASCMILGEGVDVPSVGGAILLRPTQSLTLYLQQIGRCLRPKSDGSRAVILDHAGNVHRHGLPDEPRRWSLKGRDKKDKPPPIVTCKKCFTVFHARIEAAECEEPDCPLQEVQETPERRDGPVHVEGRLEIMTDPWGWLKPHGIDPLLARGPEFKSLLELADNPDKLKLIERARGYKKGWWRHVWDARKR